MSFKYYRTTMSLKLGKNPGKIYLNKIHVPSTLSTEDVAKVVSKMMTIEAPEAELLIKELGDQMVDAVLSGMSVKVDGLGTFSPNLKTKSADSPQKVSADNIKQLVVNFRMDSKLKKEIDDVELTVAKDIDMKHFVEEKQ